MLEKPDDAVFANDGIVFDDADSGLVTVLLITWALIL